MKRTSEPSRRPPCAWPRIR